MFLSSKIPYKERTCDNCKKRESSKKMSNGKRHCVYALEGVCADFTRTLWTEESHDELCVSERNHRVLTCNYFNCVNNHLNYCEGGNSGKGVLIIDELLHDHPTEEGLMCKVYERSDDK